MLPSGASTIPCGMAPAVGSANSVMLPSAVIRPILPVPRSANQTELPGSVVIQPTSAPALGTGYVVICPCWSIRPIALPRLNQTLPSGPRVIPNGKAANGGTTAVAQSVWQSGGPSPAAVVTVAVAASAAVSARVSNASLRTVSLLPG